MPNAQRVLKWLSSRFDIFIATSAMDHPLSLYDRYLWLQEYLPFLTDRSYVFCASKKILKTDFLIDDNPRNLEMFSGTGILFTAHHNIYETHFIRVSGWNEIAAYFERLD